MLMQPFEAFVLAKLATDLAHLTQQASERKWLGKAKKVVSFFLYLSASIVPYKESEEEELAIIIQRGESEGGG